MASVDLPVGLAENWASLSPENQATASMLLAAGQGHLFAPWPAPGHCDADKLRLLAQAHQLNVLYPGGLQVSLPSMCMSVCLCRVLCDD